jgi:hypothetical protein
MSGVDSLLKEAAIPGLASRTSWSGERQRQTTCSLLALVRSMSASGDQRSAPLLPP